MEAGALIVQIQLPLTPTVAAIGVHPRQFPVGPAGGRQGAQLFHSNTVVPVITLIARPSHLPDHGRAVYIQRAAIQISQVIDIAQIGVVDLCAPALTYATGLLKLQAPALLTAKRIGFLFRYLITGNLVLQAAVIPTSVRADPTGIHCG